jgi:hypothetical protein
MSLDMAYINEILSERTRKVGGYYIDVWDGFVAENGDFMATGPALDGQTRRLRASDGVHFTKAGQRKLAHYAERELVRLFDSRPGRSSPDAISGQPQQPQAGAGAGAGQPTAPNVKPIAGPVIPLSQVTSAGGGALLGAPSASPTTKVSLPTTDPGLARTLVEGRPVEPVPGRADDFRWPPQQAQAEPASAKPEAAQEAPAQAAPAPAPLRPVIAEPQNTKRAPR